MTLKIGSLCTGYGGLDMAVEAVLDARTAWVSDIDKGACKVLDHRFPGVPNLGDMTAIDWTQVEPVDVITGGTPCQDLSHAGKRAGMTEGTRSNLWVSMREAIATIRPSLVVWENVGGAYSAEADSELVSNPRLLADTRRRDGEPVLRALGRVLGDLSSLGYVGGWHGLRAADIGAPHGRLRVFVVARDAASRDGVDGFHSRQGEARNAHCAITADADGWLDGTRSARADQRPVPGGDGERARSDRLLPSPRTSDTNGAGQHGDGGLDLRTAVTTLLPTPAVNDMGRAYTPETWDAWTAEQQAKHGNGNGHGKSLAIEAQRLLPTPNAGDAKQGYVTREEHDARAAAKRAANPNLGDLHEDLPLIAQTTQDWGIYAAAISRWEALTRPAPAPTQPSKKGTPQLSPRFVEWLMGLPAGWITDVPGVTRNEALKLCGNGVVPQQAAAALRFLLGVIAGATAAPTGRPLDPPLLGTPTARDYKGSGQGKRLAESARRGQVEAQILMLRSEVSDASSF